MRWKRKKPLWPLLGALGCLFVLAIAAPLNWHPGTPNPVRDSGAAPFPAEGREVVVLQPQCNFGEALAASSRPALPPLGETSPTLDELILIVHRPAHEPLPIQQKFDLGTLLKMRDVLLSALDRFENSVTEQTVAAPYDRTGLRISGPDDRLALLDKRDRWRAAQPQFESVGISPSFEDFGSELLQSADPPGALPRGAARLAQRNQPPVNGARPALPPRQPILSAALRTRPSRLIEQLARVADKPPRPEWASLALIQVRQLAGDDSSTVVNTQRILEELQQLAETGIRQSNPLLQPDALAAALALKRRFGVWRVLLDDTRSSQSAIATRQAPVDSETLMPTLGEIALLLSGEDRGADWRVYLMLDQLAAATSEALAGDPAGRCQLAQEVLARMEDARLTDPQSKFLATEPLAALHRQLQPWAAGPVDLELLDALVDRYETGRETRYAAAIAKLGRQLHWSTEPRFQELARHLDAMYRGANMRIAISDDLINRMIPKQKSVVNPVRERVAGSKVLGKSRTTTQLRVRIVPDTETWRFVLEAFGRVYSETRSETWPVRVHNAAKMRFQARKIVVVDREGLSTSPAVAQAQGRNELLGVDSQLDPIPIVGFLLRDLARQKHHKSRPTALKQVKSKVANTARRRMDDEADPKLDRLEQKFRDYVLSPLGQLAVLAEPLRMYTTEERAVMNVRLANREQLAAHTHRPFAPSDSLASCQLHETAVNNAISSLRLSGRRMTIVELFEFFSAKFGHPTAVPPADISRRAVIEFAARDAVRILCDGDRLELILGIKELARGRDKIKNFEVHAFFRPVIQGLEVQLVRDGSLQFSGRRLKTGPRVVLHSVIGKLLPKDQKIDLLRAELGSDPRLAGLMVTQLEIEKGWIGLAIGPAHAKRTAWRTPQERLLSTPFAR